MCSHGFHVVTNVNDKYFFTTIEKYIYLVAAHVIEVQAYLASLYHMYIAVRYLPFL